jgi:hypothetical protein
MGTRKLMDDTMTSGHQKYETEHQILKKIYFLNENIKLRQHYQQWWWFDTSHQQYLVQFT